MKILVIIVTYNAMQWAERCFDSLRRSTAKPDMFVVDNGSTDGTQAYIQEHYPEVMFQQSELNLGFGKANNLGLQYALDNDYDYVYLLNQDAWVMPDTFEKLIAISRKHPEYGILSPFQMEANMKHIDINFIRNTCCWASSPELLDDIYLQKNKEIIQVSKVMAAHWFMTRDCLNIVGGFSPTFAHYGEDDNYLQRVNFWGLKVGVTPDMKVVHDRENRQMTVKQIIFRFYIYTLTLLSEKKISLKDFIVQSLKALLMILRFKSLRPLWDMMRILVQMPAIFRNRRISFKVKRAFLEG
ncbi:glycosyltransferase family 2 protein [Xylanibacter brevis]|uniref:glycosyltransferase family 2 protein n=1 Tax=Xylanibacter brevis TaxID=83231 RepID=UPI0004878FC6|nr:glycosyltransferase family 2 protein [Xylanibacter brevis]